MILLYDFANQINMITSGIIILQSPISDNDEISSQFLSISSNSAILDSQVYFMILLFFILFLHLSRKKRPDCLSGMLCSVKFLFFPGYRVNRHVTELGALLKDDLKSCCLGVYDNVDIFSSGFSNVE